MAEIQYPTEALLLVNNELYLHLQECDTGFDYTLYDRNSLLETDGGQLSWDDLPDLPRAPMPAAQTAVFELEGIEAKSVYYAPLEFLETLQEVNLADAEAKRETVLDKMFLEGKGDAFAIYQLRRDDALISYAFVGTDWLKRKGLEIQRRNYKHIYTGKLDGPQKTVGRLLNELYEQFNVDHPENFHGHSLSVSDIIALRLGGKVSFHYVDSFGFEEVPGFIKPENPLRNAEMAVEDDLGMIDGIINNGRKAEPAEAPSRPADIISQLRRELPKPNNEIPKNRGVDR